MPRKRDISPDFFTNDDLYDAEVAEGLPIRVAYAGIWTCADRRGRFEWKPKKLKHHICPRDPVDFEQVLFALVRHGFVRCYRVADRIIGDIPTFLKHQHPHPREMDSKLPAYTAKAQLVTHASPMHAADINHASSMHESYKDEAPPGQPGGIFRPSGPSGPSGSSGPSGPSEEKIAADANSKPSRRRPAPTPDSAVPAPAEPAINWVGKCVDLWRELAGEIPAARLGKALKPVHDAVGLDDLLTTLRWWLEHDDPKFGPEAFARSYRKTLDDLKPIEVYDPVTGDPTPAFLAAWQSTR